jgi:hypothetical protein
MLGCSIDNTCVKVNVKCGKQCSTKRRMGLMFSVFSVRGNVSSAIGKEDSAEIEKTGEEHYTLLFMVSLLSLTSGPLKRRLSITSSLDIFDYVSPVRVAI